MNLSFHLEVSQRVWASKKRLKRILAEISASDLCLLTVYISPGSDESHWRKGAESVDGETADIVSGVIARLGASDTGYVLFVEDERVVAVEPPFPLEETAVSRGADTGDIARLLDEELRLAVVLLRLGKYSVGIFEGDKLVASKTDTRHVKSRHRKGGSSQRRFERSRERLIREIYDAACKTARNVFEPYQDRIDYVLMGGERHTLGGFTRRCDYIKRMAATRLQRTLQVDRPGLKALQNMPREIWKSRVTTFAITSMSRPPPE